MSHGKCPLNFYIPNLMAEADGRIHLQKDTLGTSIYLKTYISA